MLNDHQVKKPPTVERLTNQLNTLPALLLTAMYARKPKSELRAMDVQGRPQRLILVKIFGALPLRARPSRRNEH